jgi:beta-N-acetylhexosaminidase
VFTARLRLRFLSGVTGLFLLVAPFFRMPNMSHPPHAHADDAVIRQRVDDLMKSMTLRQKVGQLFMVSLYGSRLLQVNEQFIHDYTPGAVALFGYNLDYQSAAETTALINAMQQAAVENGGIPMLVAVDQEGGRVWRLINGFTHFPPPLYLGAAADPAMADLIGQAVGREIRGVGVNMNLAPVADLLTRDDALDQRSVLFQRTMGQNPEVVGALAGAMIQGMAVSGVIGVVKHYPGHSPTTTDSHRAVATVEMDRSTFEDTNLRVFAAAIENGAEVVMAGHVYYPAIEPVENLPASLSPTMIGILRDELGFDGVIMTDALDMGAILTNYSAEEASLMALQAGADLLAMGPNMPFDWQKASLDRVYEAAQSGELPMARLDEAVRRVLLLKARHSLLDWQALDPAAATDRIRQEQTGAALVRAFESAVTVVKDTGDLLPLSPADRVAIIYPAIYRFIGEECRLYLPDVVYVGYTYNLADWEYNAVVNAGRNADKVIVFAENLHQNAGQRTVISYLPPEKTIFVSLSTPYDWEFLMDEKPAGFAVAYANTPEAQRAACHVLAGAAPARGTLPVALDGFSLGAGLTYEASPISLHSTPKTGVEPTPVAGD